MGLIQAVIGILAEDHAFDRVQGCVTRPGLRSVTPIDTQRGLVLVPDVP